MKKLLGLLFLVLILAAGVALFNRPLVNSAQANGDDEKVTICHRTDSTSNPYEKKSPNKSGNVDGHDNHNGPIFPDKLDNKWGDIIPPFDYGDNHHYAGKNWNEVGEAWLNNDCKAPKDQCSNIEGLQVSVPGGDYQSDGQCFPKTAVCADDSYDNYGGADHRFDSATEVANNELCANNQVECPANSTPNSDKVCTCNSGYHQVNTDNGFTCEIDPTLTPTPTQTPTNTGGPGDGRSDGRSDGLSSCPSCTQAPQGQVLGASTGPTQAVLGLSNTSGEENSLPQLIQILGALTSTGLGFAFFKKNA